MYKRDYYAIRQIIEKKKTPEEMHRNGKTIDLYK